MHEVVDAPLMLLVILTQFKSYSLECSISRSPWHLYRFAFLIVKKLPLKNIEACNVKPFIVKIEFISSQANLSSTLNRLAQRCLDYLFSFIFCRFLKWTNVKTGEINFLVVNVSFKCQVIKSIFKILNIIATISASNYPNIKCLEILLINCLKV